MTSLASLATELLIQIVSYISPLGDTTPDSSGIPALKNLGLTCRRLHSICFHHLFASVRLHLRQNTSTGTISRFRAFMNTHSLRPTITHVRIRFGPHWNATKNGLELKKLLWEVRARSLTLEQTRGPESASVREKCAKWSYGLETLETLTVRTLDDSNELKMLLLRVCPVSLLVVDDGSLREAHTLEDSSLYSYRYTMQIPGIAQMKPGIFPNLRRVVYTATWPVYGRVEGFLAFVDGLPVLRELEITLMGGEDAELKLGKEGYRWSEDEVRYRDIVQAYTVLTRRIDDGLRQLRVVRIGDMRIPWRGEVMGPMGWEEDRSGLKNVWRRIEDVS